MHSLTLVHSQLLGRGTVEDRYFVDKVTLCIGFTHHSHSMSTTTATSSLLVLEIPLPNPDFRETQIARCHCDEILYVIVVDVCESGRLSYNERNVVIPTGFAQGVPNLATILKESIQMLSPSTGTVAAFLEHHLAQPLPLNTAGLRAVRTLKHP
jgi:hypothetical protein